MITEVKKFIGCKLIIKEEVFLMNQKKLTRKIIQDFNNDIEKSEIEINSDE